MANLKFYKMAQAPVGTVEKPLEAGAIWFNTTNHSIEVYSGSTWSAFSGVLDAVIENEKLTVTKYDGSKVSVDFSIYATDEALELLAGRVSTLEGTVAGHGESISGLSGRMTTVEGKATAAETKLAGLTGTVAEDIAAAVKVEKERAEAAEKALGERIDPLATASADYEERIGVLESFISGGEEGESVQDLIDAAIAANNTSVVTPGLAAKADKATYEAYIAANDERVAAVKKTAEDEVTRATAAEALINEKFGAEYSKDNTVAASIAAAQKAADDARAIIDEFLSEEGISDEAVNSLKEIVDYMEKHGTEYQGVVTNLNTLNTDVATLKGDAETAGSVAKAVADAEGRINATIEENEKTTAAALTELNGRVDVLEAMNLGDVVEGFEARIAANEAAVATVDSRIATAKSGAEATAAADATSKANTAESNAKGYADGLIAAEVTRSNKYADDAVAVEAAKVSANTTAIAALDAKVTEGLAWVTFE